MKLYTEEQVINTKPYNKIKIPEMLCTIFGHKWKIYYIYNMSADFKCERCNGMTKDFAWEKPNIYKKAKYYNNQNK